MMRATLAALAALVTIARVEANLADCQSEWATIASSNGFSDNSLACYPNTETSTASDFFKGTMCSAECRMHLQPLHDFCVAADKGASSLCTDGSVKGTSGLTFKMACSQVMQVHTDTKNCAAEKAAEPLCRAQFTKFDANCSKPNVTLAAALAGRDQICALDLENRNCSALVEETAQMCQRNFDNIDSSWEDVCGVLSKVVAKEQGKENLCYRTTDIRRYTTKDYDKRFNPSNKYLCPTLEQIEERRRSACDDEFSNYGNEYTACPVEGGYATFHDYACFELNRTASCKKHFEGVFRLCSNTTTGCAYNDKANLGPGNIEGYIEKCSLLASIMDPNVESKCRAAPSSPPSPPSPPPTLPPVATKEKKALVGMVISLQDTDVTDDLIKAALASALSRDGVVTDLDATDIELVTTYKVQSSAVFKKEKKDINLGKLAAAVEKELELPGGAVVAKFQEAPSARRLQEELATSGSPTRVIMDITTTDFSNAKDIRVKLSPDSTGKNSDSVKAIFSDYGDDSASVPSAPEVMLDVAAKVPVTAAELEAVKTKLNQDSFKGTMVGSLYDQGATNVGVRSTALVSDAAAPPQTSRTADASSTQPTSRGSDFESDQSPAAPLRTSSAIFAVFTALLLSLCA